MSFSATERARLASLFLELGPDAPTLCEGWDTRDLAVHLYLRENNLLAAAGMFVPGMSGLLTRATAKAGERDYAEVVRDWADGPGRFNPVRAVDPLMNTAEHFIHHEDVRRGDGVARPRDFSRVVQEQLYRFLATVAPRNLRGSAVPVILHPTGFPRIVAADQRGVSTDGENVLRLRGDVGELLLWVFGRDVVDLKVEGNLEDAGRSSL